MSKHLSTWSDSKPLNTHVLTLTPLSRVISRETETLLRLISGSSSWHSSQSSARIQVIYCSPTLFLYIPLQLYCSAMKPRLLPHLLKLTPARTKQWESRVNKFYKLPNKCRIFLSRQYLFRCRLDPTTSITLKVRSPGPDEMRITSHSRTASFWSSYLRRILPHSTGIGGFS